MYRVIKRFYDLKTNHAYNVGDIFPHNGVEDEQRVAELKSNNNRLGVSLIEEIAEKPKRAKKKTASDKER